MPYELSFTKPLDVPRSDDYINECCYGGDVISDELQPLVTARYGDVEANQEDWGWFLWFREGDVRLAIDIMCDDPAAGAFRVRLTSRKRGWLFTKVVDTPELEELRSTVTARLTEWAGVPVSVERVDD